MANPYFEFRRFSVRHDRCSMKVTTEASLFGAWVSQDLKGREGRALDLGTGTGLLSLILAQETAVQITALEIDEEAADQATENVALSSFANNIQVEKGDGRQWNVKEGYDYIISNPPFYDRDLLSPKKGKQIAHHSETLNLTDLADAIDRLLKTEGEFFLLFPFKRREELIKLFSAKGLLINKELQVSPKDGEPPFRIFLKGSRKVTNLDSGPFSIRSGDLYSEEFVELMRPIYQARALKHNPKDNRSGV